MKTDRDKYLIVSSLGFTLVEVMVSASLLALLSMAVFYMTVQQKKGQAALGLQDQGNQALHEVISQIEAAPETFPVLLSPTGNALTFAGCFSEQGTAIPNYISGDAYFAILDLPLPLPIGPITPPIGPQLCPPGTGGVEVHVTRGQAIPGGLYNVLNIHAIILDRRVGATVTTAGQAKPGVDDARQYAPANLYFDASIRVGR